MVEMRKGGRASGMGDEERERERKSYHKVGGEVELGTDKKSMGMDNNKSLEGCR
jgi:hypothetical protein